MGCSLQENYWNRKNVDDEIIRMEGLKEVIKKTPPKNGKPPGEDNLNSELYKYVGDSFYERKLFLIAFIGWEKYRENGKTVLSYIQERCQIKVENLKGIRLLNACCKL
jgi:hypothetical protein